MAKNFAVREYEVETKKIEGAFSIALVSDVHGKVYGEDNEPVAQALAAMDPDFILLPGDLVSAEREETDEPAVRLVERLAKVAPLFISPGNHERALRYKKLKYGNGRYDALRKAFAEAGARFLSNSSTFADNGEESARLTGLDLPLWKYTKFKRPELSAEELHERLGKSDGRHFQILLAHNPAFIDQYFEWGADLVVSGHYHGGLVRGAVTGRSLMDPYGFALPKYGYGLYENDGAYAVVTSGIGDHSLPVRVFNPHEAVHIKVRGRGYGGN